MPRPQGGGEAMADAGRPTETVTIMMTDVEGSTALRLQRGDPIADEILGSSAAIVRDQLRRHAGRERQFLGDGFLLSFGSPGDAVACAVGIQRALEEHNLAEPDRWVRVRIGIHVGEVGERDGELSGQAVHAAARVMAEAAGGQILVSADLRDGVEPDHWTFADRGLFWLKGFPERWRLYEVSWGGAARGRRAHGPAPPLTPMVDRDDERADLRRAAKEALGGHGRLVLVAGEVGAGKTRLVTEIAREFEARGTRVLTGSCAETDGALPYLPYVEIIEQAAADPRSPLGLRDALTGVAPEIARMAPGLRRFLPDIGAPVELPPELAQRYVWNSVGEFLTRAAQRQPLLLVVEDLHWADEPTIRLTEYLAPLLPELPVLILGTYRDAEIDVAHPLSRLLSRLGRRRLLDRISLRRLSSGGVRAMVEALTGRPAPEELVRLIESETEGNPFFIEEVFLHLAESGELFDEHGQLRRDLHVDEVSVPEGVRLVVGQRLERLSRPTRDALTAAAVLGRTFEPGLVSEVTGGTPDDLLEAFDEAELARLVAPVEQDGRLAFGHELIRQTLLAGLSTLRRERLHLRAADAIESDHARSHSDGIEVHAADLAHHLARAGRSADPARLVRYLGIAGAQAFDAAAFDDSVARFGHALHLLPPDERETRAELLERQALALRGTGRWDDALRTMDDALHLYQALGRTEALGRLAWAMVYQLTWTARPAEAVQVGRRALDALGDVVTADRARLISAMACATSLSGDYPTATAMFAQARGIAEQVGDERALADVLHVQTVHHMGFAEFPDGVRAGLRAAEVFEREGALWDLCSVQAFVVYLDGTVGGRQAAGLADRTMELAHRLGHLGAVFLLLNDRVRGAVARGDLPSVESLGRQMIDVCRQGGLPWLFIGHLVVGFSAHWQGDVGRAEAELRRAVEQEPPGVYAGQSVAILARFLAHVGRTEEVGALYESARSMFPSGGPVSSLGSWNCMFSMVEALYLGGFRQEAAALSLTVEEALLAGRDWVSFDCRRVRTRAGVAAAAGGRWDDAERHFARALDDAGRTSNLLEAADVRRLHARMLLDRGGPGDGTRATGLLTEALAQYRRFRMPGYAAEVERMLDAAQSPATIT
ncbi:ATP-binding protein [Geodermatophilus sp. SYSU D00691]